MFLKNHFFSWHQADAQRFLTEQENRSHAYLFHGQQGIGKGHFAWVLSKALLCTSNHHKPCNQCQSCHWMDLNHHPDFKCVVPDILASDFGLTPIDIKDKLSKDIRVEQVRGIENFAQLSSHQSGLRVIMIYPTENMNLIAANALLKILEEPPKNTLFLLVTHQMRALLPTIVSRCRLAHLKTPAIQESVHWLLSQGFEKEQALSAIHAHAGSVIPALTTLQEGTNWRRFFLDICSKQEAISIPYLLQNDTIKSQNVLEILHGLQQITTDLILTKLGNSPRYFPQYNSIFNNIVNRLPVERLFKLNQFLTDQKKKANHPLNEGLFLQVIFQKFFVLLNFRLA
ncbi:MAG: DNA polymerase III subunit delta' [Alcaligenaceae bacterium]|nr:DNA polymerase III subunit delta' [Alcaligenaceae bacterium]